MGKLFDPDNIESWKIEDFDILDSLTNHPGFTLFNLILDQYTEIAQEAVNDFRMQDRDTQYWRGRLDMLRLCRNFSQEVLQRRQQLLAVRKEMNV